MRTMILIVGSLFLTDLAEAAIVFSVAPVSQTVMQGDDLLFDIYIESSSGAVTIDAIDVNVNAGPGDGSGGVFSEGQTFLLSGDPFDVESIPGQAFSTNFESGGTSISGPTRYGTLVLSTTGVDLGMYQVTLDQLAANSPTSGAQDTMYTGAQYTVIGATAVPEPSSVCILGACLAIGAARIRRKRAQTETRGFDSH